MATEVTLKESVVKVLDELPPEGIATVLDFALFMKSKTHAKQSTSLPIVKTGSFAALKPLIGRFDLERNYVIKSNQPKGTICEPTSPKIRHRCRAASEDC